MAEDKSGKKIIAQNREARHEYFVIEALETGIELVGTEVKSLRAGGVNLKDSWADIDDGELIVKGMHISPYEQGNIFNKDPRRPRRLLAHKTEIRRLGQQIKLQGYTLVPLSLYFKHGRVKLELGLCKGKKLYDKRASAAARDAKRDIDRALKTQRLKAVCFCFPGGHCPPNRGAVMVSTGRERREQRAVAVHHDKSAN